MNHIQEIIREVEEKSGFTVVLKHSPEIPTLATVRMARREGLCHVVQYQKEGSETDYLIAYQLGFILRQYSLAESERWDLAVSDLEKSKAVVELDLAELPKEVSSSLIDSLMIQLRSCVIGLKVDEWIMSDYPILKKAQFSSVTGQLNQNVSCLSPEIRDKFPRKLIDANTSMNAVYAKYWSEKTDDLRHFLPYLSIGYSDIARRLYDVFLDTPDDPLHDSTLIQKWAEILRLDNLYHLERKS